MKKSLVIATILIASILLAACGVKPGAVQTQVVEVTRIVQVTSVPPIATSLPTWTPPPANTPEPTTAPTLAPTNPPAQIPAASEGQADVRSEVGKMSTNGWDIVMYDGVTDQMKTWAGSFKAPALDWSQYPNVDFPKHDFLAKDGVEYGMAESAFCQQDQTCDVNVPAMHYRLITGDYAINGVDECKKASDTEPGCGIILVNVGNVTAMFRDQHVDYGFTVEGRYWNGDAMPVTLWALSSNTAYNMLNLEGNVNMGANCSVPGGCASVRLTIVIMSGNQILLKATTTVTR